MRTRTQPPAGTLGPRHRRRRWPMVVLAVLLLVLGAVFSLRGGWYFSGGLGDLLATKGLPA